MFGGLGMGEMILIFLVVLLLFGAKRLPEIGSSLGKGIREFKSSVREVESELKRPTYDQPQQQYLPPQQYAPPPALEQPHVPPPQQTPPQAPPPPGTLPPQG